MSRRVTVYTIHDVDPEHLARVTAEMQTLGAPTIRVVDCGDHYRALEGTHRLHAAAALGLTPEFVVLAQDELVAADSLDWQDLVAGESYPAGELAYEMFGMQSQALVFEL